MACHIQKEKKKKATIDSSLETMEVRRQKECPYFKNWNLGKGKGKGTEGKIVHKELQV